MAQRIEEYWERVNREAASLNAKIPEGKPQEVFIYSLQNYDKGTSEGHITVCETKLAARRIVESTHRLATEDEVEAYLNERNARFQNSNERDARRKADNQPVIVVDSGTHASRLVPQEAADVIAKANKGGQAKTQTA